MAEKTLYGYAGKILRLDLTNLEASTFPSFKYLPEYIGGRALGTKIFWDEVGPGVGAFDAGNKLIFAPGPTTATGIPTGGRSEMCGIAPNSLPEQFSYGGMGGFCGTMLKYAGYDAFIIEGKAEKPTYILIDDDKISFLDAKNLWGMLVHDTQRAISAAHGNDVYSMVIGPAGENLCRNACITSGNDFTFSKSGFGAVFGSKNLKAVAVRGTGKICPADVEKILELRMSLCKPQMTPNPTSRQTALVSIAYTAPSKTPWKLGKLACSPGCNSRCQRLMMDIPSAVTGEPVSQIEKCVSGVATSLETDTMYKSWQYIQTPYNNIHAGALRSYPVKPMDDSDPDFDLVNVKYIGDKVNYIKTNFEKGCMQNQLCCEYGIDKYDMTIWYVTWLSMCKQEGLLDDLDFGMEVDVDDPAFIRHFIEMVVYRKGIGDIFAEGMARAIRKLGKAKYGDTIYKNRYNQDGEQLDIPVSLESGWGNCAHWQGRGYMGTPKWLWLFNSLSIMVNTRDAMSSAHPHLIPEEARAILEDPDRSPVMARANIWNENKSIIKDSITSCEWQSPDRYWPTMETEMFKAATGEDLTPEELMERADRARLIFRAILIRNFGRCRDLEVEEIYPFLTYPDPWGERENWDDWNDTVDVYYKTAGYDRATGWPLRSTWERAGLKDVADELEAIGKLPLGDEAEYVRKANPFDR